MKIVFFGLTVTSSWGNGHATLHRGLLRALREQGHTVTFFERDVPYYASYRDAQSLPYADVQLYVDWEQGRPAAKKEVSSADVAVITSYCPDGAAASELVLESGSNTRTVFYDMDTPVTLSRLAAGETVAYLPPGGLADFDLVLSYTGGEALAQLSSRLGAVRPEPFYGWVDATVYGPASPSADFACDLSYLGTYAADRHRALTDLMLTPARQLSDSSFVIGGAMYPDVKEWPANIRYFAHINPSQHTAFYSSAPLTLSVTRGAMASYGYCPSGRLFEAAACGTAVLSDWWEGLDEFFEPGPEILIARDPADTIDAIGSDRIDLLEIGRRARERTLDCHTADIRARQFVRLVERNASSLSNQALVLEDA